MNRFTHFELAAADLEKTAAFYRAVFGWQIEKWAGPVDYWMVTPFSVHPAFLSATRLTSGMD